MNAGSITRSKFRKFSYFLSRFSLYYEHFITHNGLLSREMSQSWLSRQQLRRIVIRILEIRIPKKQRVITKWCLSIIVILMFEHLLDAETMFLISMICDTRMRMLTLIFCNDVGLVLISIFFKFIFSICDFFLINFF